MPSKRKQRETVLGEQFSWHQVTGAAGLIAAIALSFPNESEAEGVRGD